MTEQVRLKKDGNGGYTAADGRFTIRPQEGFGAGGNSNGGWSPGRKAWLVADTAEKAALTQYGHHFRTLDRLYEVRDLITGILLREADEQASADRGEV